ncbi:MAG: hypothetical protein MUC49_17585 [Raineya sp.]|jgi:hypothetical protein|nr:hypothetical protein [Raineya sp.]
MKKILIVLSFSLFLKACQTPESTVKVNYYYDLEQKVNEQIQLLKSSPVMFQKATYAEGRTEVRDVNDISWEKELAFFLHANINKSAFRGLYKESQITSGDTLFKIYEAKDLDLKVEKLVIGLSKNTQELWSVQAKTCTDNYLYSSQRELKMYCSNNKLQSYYIKGKQKMIFSDPEYFEIKAKRK